MSKKKSKLIKSLIVKELEEEGASHDEFQKAVSSDILSKKEKRNVIFNIDELGNKSISDKVLEDEEEKD